MSLPAFPHGITRSGAAPVTAESPTGRMARRAGRAAHLRASGDARGIEGGAGTYAHADRLMETAGCPAAPHEGRRVDARLLHRGDRDVPRACPSSPEPWPASSLGRSHPRRDGVLAGGRNASRTHYTEKGASVNMRIHPSDSIARQAQRMSTPVAGSLEELEALARIDEARIDDIETSSGRSLRRQRRALRRHWSDRGAQLG